MKLTKTLAILGLAIVGAVCATGCATEDPEAPLASDVSVESTDRLEPMVQSTCTIRFMHCKYGKGYQNGGTRGGCYSLNHPDRVEECVRACEAAWQSCIATNQE